MWRDTGWDVSWWRMIDECECLQLLTQIQSQPSHFVGVGIIKNPVAKQCLNSKCHKFSWLFDIFENVSCECHLLPISIRVLQLWQKKLCKANHAKKIYQILNT